MAIISPREYQALLRQDLTTFIDRTFCHLNPTTPYLHNWHIEAMAAKLEACRQGASRRLIINISPRHLKSLCASVALPAWWLGQDPSAQILCVSQSEFLFGFLQFPTVMEKAGGLTFLEDILEGEETHVNWIEAQLTLIAQMGEPHYLAQQVKSD